MSASHLPVNNTRAQLIFVLLIVVCFMPICVSQEPTPGPVPHELWGEWKITRELNTRTVSCWGNKEAQRVLGTAIRYSANTLSWRNSQIKAESATKKIITAGQFHDEGSGGGANDSQVDFQQLGIRQEKPIQTTIEHPDAKITGTTTEFPGDQVLMKSPDVIIFSLCNLYFEAKRVNPH